MCYSSQSISTSQLSQNVYLSSQTNNKSLFFTTMGLYQPLGLNSPHHLQQTTLYLRQHQASLQKARLSWVQKDMSDTYMILCIHFLSYLIAIYIAHRSSTINFTYDCSLEKSLKSIYYSHFAKRDVILNFNLGPPILRKKH